MSIKDIIKEQLGAKVISWDEKSSRRIYFSIKKENILEIVRFLFKELGLRFSIASGSQTPDGFEILYHFCHDQTGEIYSVRVFIEDKNNPAIDAITPLFPGQNGLSGRCGNCWGLILSGIRI